MLKGGGWRLALAVSAALNLLLAPLAVNQHLRWTYTQTLAHWRSKVVRPDRVYIGDSLTAGGGDFGHFGDLNLGESGLRTDQVAAMMPRAQAYNPRHIYVMAGTNDVEAATPPDRLAAAWARILADRRVVVVLAPHTVHPAVNVKIDVLNASVEAMARRAGRPMLRIPGLTRPDGTLWPRYTTDGVHLTPAAYCRWRAAL